MKLYRYLDKHIIHTLKNRALKVSCLLGLNDPFDCLPSYDFNISRRELKQNITSSDALNNLWQRDSFVRDKFRTFGEFKKKMQSKKSRKELFDQYADKEYLRRLYEENFKNTQHDKFLLSLTENENNFLMWAHYSGSHEGAIIELNIENKESFKSFKLRKVRYENIRPKHNPVSGMWDGKMLKSFDVFQVKAEALLWVPC